MTIQNVSDGGAVATTVLVIGEGAALFAAFCPSWFTVRSPFFHDQAAKEGNIDAIRQGEIAATVITIAVGWAGGAMVGSTYPLIGAAFVSAIMVAGYEWSIKHPSTDKSALAQSPAKAAMQYRSAK